MQINITGIGGATALQTRGMVWAELCPRLGDHTKSMMLQLMVVLISNLPSSALAPSALMQERLELADPDYNIPGPIEAILGAGAMAKIMQEGVRHLENGLIVQNTRLGWIISGNEAGEPGTAQCCTTVGSTDGNLPTAIRRLWEIEELNDKAEMKPDEKWCEENSDATVERGQDGRYIVTIPIKPGKENALGESRAMALHSFQALERQFARDSQFAAWYVAYMRELQQAGYMQVAAGPVAENKPHSYIPHHGVRPPKKPRVVFDASAVTSSGLSFNDIQLPGPRMQDDLYDIIIRFREGKVGMSADVQKMFPQIGIHKSQWDMQRIFWRESTDVPIQEYQLVRVTFGMASSTYNAVKAIQRCAEEYRQQYPLAYEAVHRSFYVDDFLKSVNTVDKTLAVREQLEAALQKGCFPLVKWALNKLCCLSLSEHRLEVWRTKHQPVCLGCCGIRMTIRCASKFAQTSNLSELPNEWWPAKERKYTTQMGI